ncbi:serine/threonine-protein kinase [Nocardia sp. NPDC056100]|uniref:serine/threonine-protein kinase n=1 Tax=Nocardia sp. NPDC056100 TaxID=3345712 RepID=UPI0035DB2C24
MTIRALAQGDPQRIGRYRILGVLGSGGMGRVLLGVGPDGRLVAVKQVHAHLLGEREYRARFRREVTASTRVSGAFTAPVIDFDVDTSAPWLASVFVIGVPLDKIVTEYGPLPPMAVRMLAAGLASALQAIHRAGLIHRDLKPANVLLAADGPRVIDFGIAQAAENQGLTEAGSVLGSPAYMSPEQALAEPLTPASDVFALGSLLVMAATGASPFVAASMAYTLFNIAHVEPDLGGVPPELRDLVGPCLRKDPATRPTPTQILDHLGQPPEHGRIWPEPVHAEIDRVGAELAMLASDPNATVVLSGGRRGAFTRKPTEFAIPQGVPRGRGTRTVLIMVAVLIALATTVGAAWMRWSDGGDTPQATLTGFTLAQMREVDTCAWLSKALGSTIPAGLDPDWPTTVSDWTLTTSETWGCTVTAPGIRSMLDIAPGDFLVGFGLTANAVSGQTILGSESDGYCGRAVKPAGAQVPWGISVEIHIGEKCALPEYVITRLMSVAEPPRRADADRSLATVDPCTLVDHSTLTSLIGAIPEPPKEVSAHSCVWEGADQVTVKLEQIKASVLEDPMVDLGDGKQLIAPKSTVDAICTRDYPFREVGTQREQVEIKVHGGNDNAAHCSAAESIARMVIEKLPK